MRSFTRVYLLVLTLLTLATVPFPAPPGIDTGARELSAFLDHTPSSAHRERIPGYRREAFGPGWATLSSGCTVREQLLVEHFSLDDDPPAVPAQRSCPSSLSTLDPAVVITDPYTGSELVRTDVEIDHLVPLAAAWDLGAHSWDDATREAFANDPANLVVTSREANQEKSDKLPSEWLPPARAARCDYAIKMASVAYRYSLALPEGDKKVLRRQCRLTIGAWFIVR